MASFLDVCKYTPTAGGTTDWTFSAAVTGYQSPASAGVVNSATYRYRAESADLTQWEVGTGVYNTGTGVLTRATVLYNSSATGTGSGQSGAGTKINFSTTPTVGIVLLQEDVGGLGQIPGTATNDNASAGNIGEFISSSIGSGSSVSLSNSTAANITSISLTAGDWDVWGQINTNTGAGTVISLIEAYITTVSATRATAPNGGAYFFEQQTMTASTNFSTPVGMTRLSLSTTTTVFLGIFTQFTVSTLAAFGFIGARRRR